MYCFWRYIVYRGSYDVSKMTTVGKVSVTIIHFGTNSLLSGYLNQNVWNSPVYYHKLLFPSSFHCNLPWACMNIWLRLHHRKYCTMTDILGPENVTTFESVNVICNMQFLLTWLYVEMLAYKWLEYLKNYTEYI